MLNKFNKFTNRLSHALNWARINANQLNKQEIDLEDLFLALGQVEGALAKEILIKAGFSAAISPNQQLSSIALETDVDYSLVAKKALQKASLLAADLGHHHIGTEHLLFSLLEVDALNMEKIFIKYQVDSKKILTQIKTIFKSATAFEVISGSLTNWQQLSHDLLDEDLLLNNAEEPEMFFPEAENLGLKEPLKLNKNKIKKKSALEIFARNLTDENLQKNIDPLIGRENEIKRLIQILLRRNKNNPVLLGDPGVGKTAIVEGLAKKILLGEVPDFLLDKKIYALDLTLLLAGTMMRGEFESRLKQVLEEVKFRPEIILFIDELHNIVGAGSTPGSMDAANMLKPALARGELRCIGATTFSEYKKHIEDDAALERRFQAIKVAEPTASDTLKILTGIKGNYEQHHLVKISTAAIETAVKLAERYLPEKFFPDKAIDLIDEAAAMVKINLGSVNEELRQLRLLEAELKDLEHAKEELVINEKYNEALKVKKLADKIFGQINNLKSALLLASKTPNFLGTVSAQNVAEVLANLAGIPVENLIALNHYKQVDLFNLLNQRIVGQDEVLKELTLCLKRTQAGLAGRNRPLGSFMFLGGTGVGKTETAKVLAEEFFKKENKSEALIRFDMSEFAENFNVSRLIGSPAGYVGYKEGGRLTEAVRRNPYSVVLFDEIEKAGSEVFNILLQILDSGFLNDASGKKVDFKNTIIILTSNLGSHLAEKKKFGFEDIKSSDQETLNQKNIDDYQKELKEKFRPEFLSRLDKILIFNQLDLKMASKIVDLQLKELALNLKTNKNISLEWQKKVVLEIAKVGFSLDKGARNIRQKIEELVENQLADKILATEIKVGATVKLGWKEGKIEMV
ncbi:MAG TPA: ATP-dependent Clp protease ATP-binding subunit [bacterium]|nr:ATP-dependent Clp protease ATP-binding subunit [bacterium]